jgi:XTP/dITP diphosphohydrolase
MSNFRVPQDPQRAKKLESFNRLLTIMDELRAFCPWDKKQTMESLRYLTLEEVYELSDAVLENDPQEIKKELGDIFLHLVFYSKIASEKKVFDIADVLDAIAEKLVYRHPHIYGNVKVKDEKEVSENWEKLKLKEKGNRSVLGGVPSSLPAMVKAMRIQEKAKGVGFDWEQKEQVWQKVEEELNEFKTEFNIETNTALDIAAAESEFGDLIFSLINYARFVGINPEDALERTNKKFIKRFTYLETQAQRNGLSLANMSLNEMDKFWEEAKLKNKDS